MLSMLIRSAVTVSIALAIAGVGWIVYSELGQSTADRAVHALDTTRAFIDTDVAQTADINVLLAEWRPRYQAAQTSYSKLDAAIVAAELAAEAYLSEQEALTAMLNDPGRRGNAEAVDALQTSQYEAWRSDARGVRDRALEIMRRLSDMDTTLQKLKLQADFSFDTAVFDHVPSDILELEAELDRFQDASDTIRASIGSPFGGR